MNRKAGKYCIRCRRDGADITRDTLRCDAGYNRCLLIRKKKYTVSTVKTKKRGFLAKIFS